MHEMGLIDAIVRMVDKIVQDEGLEGVKKITLEVGEISGVVPHFLTECYEAVVDGTPYEKTELVIENVPGVFRCNDCEMDFPADVEHLICPDCFGRNLTPVAGKDLTLKEIEAY